MTFILQVLIYAETEVAEFLWVPSSPSNIPVGAVEAGHKSNGDPLYLATVLNRNGHWRAGNYDPIKQCAEYGSSVAYRCKGSWKVGVFKLSE